MQSGSEHREIPEEDAAAGAGSTEEAAQGLASSNRVTQKAKGTDPGKLLILEEIGHHRQKGDPLCMSGMVQGTCQEESD
jgi:hypothetical protein